MNSVLSGGLGRAGGGSCTTSCKRVGTTLHVMRALSPATAAHSSCRHVPDHRPQGAASPHAEVWLDPADGALALPRQRGPPAYLQLMHPAEQRPLPSKRHMRPMAPALHANLKCLQAGTDCLDCDRPPASCAQGKRHYKYILYEEGLPADYPNPTYTHAST